MDEFEIYKARSYGGMFESRNLIFNEQDSSKLTRRKRLDSDEDASTMYEPENGRSTAVSSKSQAQHKNNSRYRLRAQVTVEVEPPSPTDPRREARRESGADTEGERVGRQHPVKHFHRTQTAPITAPLQRAGKLCNKSASKPESTDSCGYIVPSINLEEGHDPDHNPPTDSSSERRKSVTSPNTKNKSEQRRGSSASPHKDLKRQESRPDSLRIPSGVNMGRRRSSTGVPETLRPGSGLSASPSMALRRNSYTGLAVSHNTSDDSPPTNFYSGRRNSAITYLSDAMPGQRRPSSGSVHPSINSIELVQSLSGSIHAVERGGRGSSVGSPIDGDGTASPESLTTYPVYTLVVLGSHGVGKSTLANQLQTSVYLANTDEYAEPTAGEEHTVSLKLDEEVSVVRILDNANPDEGVPVSDHIDAYLVIYSVTDRNSFNYAQICLQELAKRKGKRSIILLVANKQDLVRNRAISMSEGKRLATKRHAKFLDVSALLDHRVDEVLVTVIRETRSLRTRLDLGLELEVSEDNLAACMGERINGSYCGGCLHQATVGLFRKLFKSADGTD